MQQRFKSFMGARTGQTQTGYPLDEVEMLVAGEVGVGESVCLFYSKTKQGEKHRREGEREEDNLFADV